MPQLFWWQPSWWSEWPPVAIRSQSKLLLLDFPWVGSQQQAWLRSWSPLQQGQRWTCCQFWSSKSSAWLGSRIFLSTFSARLFNKIWGGHYPLGDLWQLCVFIFLYLWFLSKDAYGDPYREWSKYYAQPYEPQGQSDAIFGLIKGFRLSAISFHFVKALSYNITAQWMHC